MKLLYSEKYKLFVWRGAYEERDAPRQAGFEWSGTGKCWYATSKYVAYRLLRFQPQLDSASRALLLPLRTLLADSHARDPVLPPVDGLYPFQAAGVETLVERFARDGRGAVLLADDPGLGKTPQAAVAARRLGARRLLVICPASLRLNWVRELRKWAGVEAFPYLTGSEPPPRGASVVTSYNLAGGVSKFDFDFVVVDESHNIKNPEAKRSQLILGEDGFVEEAPMLLLTGTPLPNGRPNELYYILSRAAPDVIDGLSYWAFINRYCNFVDNEIGGPVITGAKNTEELYLRLRGSGFMVRRRKAEVLSDLPPKRFKMVAFYPTGELKKVLEKEKPFSAAEILRHGIPVGSGLPEIRREMGVAKIPSAVDYVAGMLEGGVEKVAVFAHHREVVAGLVKGLKGFGVVYIDGAVSATRRQEAVDRFQTRPEIRVFVGNEAAEEGITLTAAQDVVSVEPEWVPGKEIQRVDRLHRIGQTGPVLAHILVVEGSLDAHIIGKALDKQKDIERIMEGMK